MDQSNKTEQEWKERLTAEEFDVCRKKGTERPFTGALLENKETGLYCCKCCGEPLFHSASKFNSGTGWPSFDQPVSKEAVAEEVDGKFAMVRTEVLCAKCDSHLGHVFPDGPDTTGLRYCVNSLSLNFEKEK